jgi:hypothetical protein
MWKLELIGSCKKVKSTQHWFGPICKFNTVYTTVGSMAPPSYHSILTLNIYMSHIFHISWSAYFAENFAREQLEMESIINWFIYFLQEFRRLPKLQFPWSTSSPLAHLYIVEKGKTNLGKGYGIKWGVIGRILEEHIGNLGKIWGHAGNMMATPEFF